MTDLEIVQEAQELIERKVDETYLSLLFDENASEVTESLMEVFESIYGIGFQDAKTNWLSWLAHKAFFERHTQWDGFDAGEWSCGACSAITDFEYLVPYPCPELVAQARLILGVAND